MAVKFWQKKWLLPLLLFLFSFLIIFSAPVDPDLGWHWRMGQIIWEQKTFPTTTPFSYNLPDYKVASFYWLAQVIFYFLVARVGLWSLPVATALVGSGLSLGLLFFGSKGKFTDLGLTGIFLLNLLVSLSLRNVFIGGRPMMLGMIFLVCLIYLLDSVRQGKYFPLFIFPLFFLIWANVYGDFVFGLWVLISYWGWQVVLKFEVFNRLKHWLNNNIRPEAEMSWSKVVLLGFSIIASGLATLLNPYRQLMWQSIFADVDYFHLSHIAEWASPNVNNGMGQVVVVVICLSIVFAYFNRRKLYLYNLIALVGLSLITIKSVYFFRFLLVFSVTIIWIGLVDITKDLKKLVNLDTLSKVLPWLGITFLIAQGVVFGLEVGKLIDPGKLTDNLYPYQALEFLGPDGLPGRVFNEYIWGGYLIWHRPDWPLFIYGQMPAWQKGDLYPFKDYMFIVYNPEEYAYLLDDKYKIDWVFINNEHKLAEYLDGQDGWQEVYRDDLAVIFKRAESKTSFTLLRRKPLYVST